MKAISKIPVLGLRKHFFSALLTAVRYLKYSEHNISFNIVTHFTVCNLVSSMNLGLMKNKSLKVKITAILKLFS